MGSEPSWAFTFKKDITAKKVNKHCQSRYPLLLQRLNERGDYSFSLPNGSSLSSSSRWKLKLQTVVIILQLFTLILCKFVVALQMYSVFYTWQRFQLSQILTQLKLQPRTTSRFCGARRQFRNGFITHWNRSRSVFKIGATVTRSAIISLDYSLSLSIRNCLFVTYRQAHQLFRTIFYAHILHCLSAILTIIIK